MIRNTVANITPPSFARYILRLIFENIYSVVIVYKLLECLRSL